MKTVYKGVKKGSKTFVRAISKDDIPDKERTRNLLMNWKRWSMSDPPDHAEMYYYTVSPMFHEIAKRRPSLAFDEDAALMVEEVLRVMFRPYPHEYRMLQAYYGEGMPQTEIAKELGINQASVSKYRLPAAQRIFAEQWALLIRKH